MSGAFTSSLYSQRSGKDIVAQVLRIPAPENCTRFSTHFLGLAEQASCVRLEAFLDSESGTWGIDRLTRISSQNGGTTRKSTEALPGLCFFDALHHCARFQATEESVGKYAVTMDNSCWDETPFYKDVAIAAHQVIDADGEIHPCINGRILTEGFFDDAAYATALKTKGLVLPVKPIVAPGSFIEQINKGIALSSTEKVMTTDLISRSIDKRKEIDRVHFLIEKGNDFVHLFQRNTSEHFLTAYNGRRGESTALAIMGAAFSLGVRPAIAYVCGTATHFPARAVKSKLSDFVKATENIPDYPEKRLCVEFAQAAAYAIPMEQAAQIYQLCRENKKPLKEIQRGLPFIEEAASLISLSKMDTDRLKATYLDGKCVADHFSDTVRKSWEGYLGWHEDNSGNEYDGGRKILNIKEHLEALITRLEVK